jgi:hypothetical protein
MNRHSDHDTSLGWWYGLPAIVIGVLTIVLWRPAPAPFPSPEQEAKIADLAVRLGSPSSTAVEIDERIRSFGPFPPAATASRALAEALVHCGIIRLSEEKRTQLARHLYGITVIGDDRAQAVPVALIGIQQAVGDAGLSCGPEVIDTIMRSARSVVATDPNPRSNWW